MKKVIEKIISIIYKLDIIYNYSFNILNLILVVYILKNSIIISKKPPNPSIKPC
jgi:hypothetical protein